MIAKKTKALANNNETQLKAISVAIETLCSYNNPAL